MSSSRPHGATLPCVLFLDEVDALGQKRTNARTTRCGAAWSRSCSIEMDSVAADNEGVFVLGATNAPWDVDTALRRPGRFDRMLLVLPPDASARAAILDYHLRTRPVEPGIDFRDVAIANRRLLRRRSRPRVRIGCGIRPRRFTVDRRAAPDHPQGPRSRAGRGQTQHRRVVPDGAATSRCSRTKEARTTTSSTTCGSTESRERASAAWSGDVSCGGAHRHRPHADAIPLLHQAIAEDPRRPGARCLLGLALLREGQYWHAGEAARDAIAAAPEHGRGWSLRASRSRRSTGRTRP